MDLFCIEGVLETSSSKLNLGVREAAKVVTRTTKDERDDNIKKHNDYNYLL